VSEYVVIMTTTANDAEATRIATALVEKKLAACVQASAITSTYRWQGKVTTDKEIRLLVKAPKTHYAAIEQLISSMHSYETPQILALPIVAAARPYTDWIDAETQA
jgi:periplasmic divalent cation tolerance protein